MIIKGIENDFTCLVDLTSKHNQLMSLPMLATVIKWTERLSLEIVIGPLFIYLSTIHKKLKDNFNLFMQQRVATIDKYIQI